MPTIIPISDLRNKTHHVVNLCHQGKPVFVTKNGEGELVVMSQALYERLIAKMELYQKLEEAESFQKSGHRGRSHKEVMQSLRKRLS